MDVQVSSVNRERPGRTVSGWGMLAVTVVLLLGGAAVFIYGIVRGASSAAEQPVWWMFISGLIAMTVAFVFMSGFFTLQPNEARVLILFGSYKGTARKTGFLWANPFTPMVPRSPRGLPHKRRRRHGRSGHSRQTGRGSARQRPKTLQDLAARTYAQRRQAQSQ